AFGLKGLIGSHEAVAAQAARIAGRPVRIALSRAHMYSFLGYQPRIVQKMGLGADEKGTLAAVTHDVVNLTTVTDDYIEATTEASKALYATPTMGLPHRAGPTNVGRPPPILS